MQALCCEYDINTKRENCIELCNKKMARRRFQEKIGEKYNFFSPNEGYINVWFALAEKIEVPISYLSSEIFLLMNKIISKRNIPRQNF